MAKLLLLFTVVPLIELSLLLWIDELIGLWPTVAVVLTTGIVGAWLARAEGLRVLQQWRKSMVRGRVPEEGVLGGVLVLVGGVLLVTPGVLTDLVGFLLLIPPTRHVVADRLRRRLEQKMQDGTIQVVNVPGFSQQESPPDGVYADGYVPRSQDVVMDVEGEELDDDDDDDHHRVLH